VEKKLRPKWRPLLYQRSLRGEEEKQPRSLTVARVQEGEKRERAAIRHNVASSFWSAGERKGESHISFPEAFAARRGGGGGMETTPEQAPRARIVIFSISEETIKSSRKGKGGVVCPFHRPILDLKKKEEGHRATPRYVGVFLSRRSKDRGGGRKIRATYRCWNHKGGRRSLRLNPKE